MGVATHKLNMVLEKEADNMEKKAKKRNNDLIRLHDGNWQVAAEHIRIAARLLEHLEDTPQLEDHIGRKIAYYNRCVAELRSPLGDIIRHRWRNSGRTYGDRY